MKVCKFRIVGSRFLKATPIAVYPLEQSFRSQIGLVVKKLFKNLDKIGPKTPRGGPKN